MPILPDPPLADSSGFNQAAVLAIVDSVVSAALQLGVFESVNFHEPKSPPGSGLRCAAWVDSISPIALASGLAATSGEVIVNVRVYGSMLQQPEDEVDPAILTAVTTLIGAYTGDFDFGATIRCVDLLGMYGPKLGAQAGYITIGKAAYRIMTITLPIVINDMWSQNG